MTAYLLAVAELEYGTATCSAGTKLYWCRYEIVLCGYNFVSGYPFFLGSARSDVAGTHGAWNSCTFGTVLGVGAAASPRRYAASAVPPAKVRRYPRSRYRSRFRLVSGTRYGYAVRFRRGHAISVSLRRAPQYHGIRIPFLLAYSLTLWRLKHLL